MAGKKKSQKKAKRTTEPPPSSPPADDDTGNAAPAAHEVMMAAVGRFNDIVLRVPWEGRLVRAEDGRQGVPLLGSSATDATESQMEYWRWRYDCLHAALQERWGEPTQAELRDTAESAAHDEVVALVGEVTDELKAKVDECAAAEADVEMLRTAYDTLKDEYTEELTRRTELEEKLRRDIAAVYEDGKSVLVHLEEQYTALHDAHRDLQARYAALEVDADQRNKRSDETEEAQQTRFNELAADNTTLKEQLAGEKEAVERLTSTVDETQAEHKELKAAHKQLQAQVKKLEKELAKQEKDMTKQQEKQEKALGKEIDALKKENVHLQESLAEAQRTVASASAAQTEVQQAYDALKGEHAAATQAAAADKAAGSSQAEEDLQMLRSQHKELQEEHKQLQAQVKKLEKELAKQEKDMTKQQEKQEKALGKEINALKKENERLQMHADDGAAAAAQVARIEELENDLTTHRERCAELQQVIDENTAVANDKENNKELKAAHKQLQAQVKKLEKDLTKQEKDMTKQQEKQEKALGKEIDALKKENERLQAAAAEVETLRSAHEELRGEHKDLGERHAMLEVERAEWGARDVAVASKEKTVQKDMDKLRAERDKALKALAKVEAKLESINGSTVDAQKYETLERRYADLKAMYKTKADTATKLQQRVEEQQNTVTQYEEELVKSRAKRDAMQDRLRGLSRSNRMFAPSQARDVSLPPAPTPDARSKVSEGSIAMPVRLRSRAAARGAAARPPTKITSYEDSDASDTEAMRGRTHAVDDDDESVVIAAPRGRKRPLMSTSVVPDRSSKRAKQSTGCVGNVSLMRAEPSTARSNAQGFFFSRTRSRRAVDDDDEAIAEAPPSVSRNVGGDITNLQSPAVHGVKAAKPPKPATKTNRLNLSFSPLKLTSLAL